jgi:DeoR/GlpR family transcriptional regulator of sugar metabolism
MLQVSSVTVRRDLMALQDQGLVDVVHGGARLISGRVPPEDRQARASRGLGAKAAIAASASAYVRPGDTVFLDSGTTCSTMVAFLAEIGPLTVVTTDLSTATSLAVAAPAVSVIIAAGVVDPRTASAVGELVPSVLQKFVFDSAFISASAWDPTYGATTGRIAYATLKQVAISRSRQSFLLVDATKFGATEPHVIAPLQEFDVVITDNAFGGQRTELSETQVNLVVAASRSDEGTPR